MSPENEKALFIADMAENTGTCCCLGLTPHIRRLVARVEELEAIIKAHDLCHDLHGKVGRAEFEEGCRRETIKEYGSCGWAERIAELEKENAELKALTVAIQETPKQWSTSQAPTMESLVQFAKEIRTAEDNKRLRQRIAELEAALEPFARYARHFEGDHPGLHPDYETVLMETTDAPDIRLGHCRRAAELLARKEGSQ